MQYRKFSLIELVVVFAVLSILVTMLTAKLNKLTQFSELNHCQSNLKTVYMATQLYIGDNSDHLPGPLLSGQFPTVSNSFIAGRIAPYVETKTRSDGRRKIVSELLCPSNELAGYNRGDDFRLHYRTHFSPKSSVYFGYPNRREPQAFSAIENPSEFGFLRDISKYEFRNNNRLPGWHSLLADNPAHFGTDVNVLYMDGKIEPFNMLLNP